MTKKTLTGVALAFGAALFVTACGSDDTVRSTTTTTTTTAPATAPATAGSTIVTPPATGSATTIERSTTTKTY